MKCVLYAIVATVALTSSAGDYGVLESLFGQPDITAVTGNGALTVGLNSYGCITACQWPSPGFYVQLDYRSSTGAAGTAKLASMPGVLWGVRTAGETQWLYGEPWASTQRLAWPPSPIIETTCRRPDSQLTVSQVAFVHPTLDLLAMRVTVSGVSDSPALYFYADFAPCTRLVPEVPVADWMFNARDDFAIFADGDPVTVYHFRPHQPGAEDWARAEQALVAGTLARQAGDFAQGTWIGYTTPERVAALQCGNEGTTAAAFQQASAGSLENAQAAVGLADSALSLVPARHGSSFEACVYVAFGRNRNEVDNVLQQARAASSSKLLGETVSHWRERMRGAARPDTDDPALQVWARGCVAAVLQHTDRATGAIVRCPTFRPPSALDEPRQGYWTTLALDLAGFHDLAEQHTLFYRDAIRVTDMAGAPLGSLPAALYADGTEAAPHVILELDAAAWMLASFWRHALFLEPEQRGDYLAEVWGAAELAATFLATWSDVRTGVPPLSFDPERGRDTRAAAWLLASFMGLDSALQIAETLGVDAPPEWRERRQELNVLILIQCVGDGTRPAQTEIIPPGYAEVATALLRESEERDTRLLAELEKAEGCRAAQLLCDMALSWRQKPEKLAQLRPLVKTAVSRALKTANQDDPVFPDALTAALAYVGVMMAYGATT